MFQSYIAFHFPYLKWWWIVFENIENGVGGDYVGDHHGVSDI